MTELILIPPFSLLSQSIGPSASHLLLPQLFEHHQEYRDYVKQAVTADTFSILDNGAFEKAANYDGIYLVDLAKTVGISEVVVPDVLGDSEQTIAKFQEFIDELEYSEWNVRQYMVVVQGKTYEDCCAFIDEVIYMKGRYGLGGFTTLGIPKHLCKTTEGNEIRRSSIRLRLANYIKSKYQYDRFQIHFLGANPAWISEIAHLETYGVRSIDTSMPYVYAFQDLDMSVPYVQDNYDLERQEEYFDLVPDIDQQKLITTNINFMRRVIDNA
jgi:DNA-binding Lrp family transcriptional regulator